MKFCTTRASVPLTDFLTPGRGGPGSWKWKVWQKGRPKRKKVRPPKVKPKPLPPPPPPPLPTKASLLPPLPPIRVSPRGEHVYDWYPGAAGKGARPSKPSRAIQLTGGMNRAPSGLLEVQQQRSRTNGQALRARIRALGFTTNVFANRVGLSTSKVRRIYAMHAGQVPLDFERLVEFEEFMAAVAAAVDARDLPGRQSMLRRRLAHVLEQQIGRLPAGPRQAG